MKGLEHDEIRGLLGAYALNAVDEIERAKIARHVSSCESCAHEVRLLTETAAELAHVPEPEPASDLVERITAALPRRRGRTITRVVSAVAAIAVVVAGLLGGALVRERDRNERFEATIARATRVVRLTAQHGFQGSGNVYIASGIAAVALDRMPDPGKDREYQVWAIDGGRPVSLGVVGDTRRITMTLPLRTRPDAVAVSIEPDGGSPVPSSDPILSGA